MIQLIYDIDARWIHTFQVHFITFIPWVERAHIIRVWEGFIGLH